MPVVLPTSDHRRGRRATAKSMIKTRRCSYLHKAETLLGRRSVMANYASVEVKSHQKMLETFLKWTDGLQTKKYKYANSKIKTFFDRGRMR